MTGERERTPKKRCYVASPCGFADSTDYWYRKVLLPALEQHVEVIDPWAADTSTILNTPVAQRTHLWVDLGETHYSTIDTCELLVAILDQEPPDNGTVCEVAHAAARQIPVIGYRNDKRMSGEEGVSVNLMILAAIRRSGGQFTTNLESLIAAIRAV